MINKHAVIQYLCYSSVFASCCATALAIVSICVLLPDCGWQDIQTSVNFVFGSTLALYNAHNIYKVYLTHTISKRNNWNKKHLTLLWILLVSGILLGVWSILHLTILQLSALLLLGIMSIIYSFPLIKWKGLKRSIKSFGRLKPLYLAFTWALVTTFAPLIILKNDLSTIIQPVGVLLLSKCLLLWPLCLIFDIKDAAIDKSQQVFTYANTWRPSQYRRLLYFSIAIQLINAIALLFTPYFILGYAGITVSIILLFILSKYEQCFQQEIFQLFIIDGMMLVYASVIIYSK